MEESAASTVLDGEIIAIQFGLASHREIVSGQLALLSIEYHT